MKYKKKINCGVIGLGWWGMQMCNFILKSKKFNIKVIYDTDASKVTSFAKKFGSIGAKNIDELVTSDIECVFIFSPNQFHFEHVRRAAQNKKHIFLEKPIANNTKEAVGIEKICSENGVTLAVGHNVRYYNIFKEAKRLVKNGSIGEIVYIDGNRSRPIGYGIDEKSWRFYTNTCNGGPLIQMAIHLIDVVRYVCGIDVVEAKKISLKKIIKTENDESFAVLIKFNKDALFHVFSSYIVQESFYLNFFGTSGTLYVDAFNGLYIQKEGEMVKKKLKYSKNNPQVDEILEFYNALDKKNDFTNPTTAEAIQNVELVEKIVNLKN